jgi:4-hydroxyphenylpyruvate dioxygenase-like putative hemolysin
MTQGIGTTTITQVGIVVRDIEKSIDHYMQVFGVTQRPSAIITDTVDAAHTNLRGESTEARAKLAFFPMGQVTIELIEPVGGPSTWKEFLDTHGEGVHHIAFQVKGTDQVVQFLEGQGVPFVQQGDYTGGMYTYVDGAPKLGVMLELLENF